MKFITITLLGMLIISCNNKPNPEPAGEKINKLSTGFTNTDNLVLGELSEINFGEALNVTGMIDVPPNNKAIISSYIGGYVVNTPLLIGDKVSKGQILVTLENPEYVELQQNYLELSEQLTYLESEYKRQKTLYDEKITSEKSYLKAQSVYKSTLAHFNGLQKKLQMLNINPRDAEAGTIVSKINLYAPIEGHISKVNVSNGIYVSAQDIIMEIVDTDHIHLELSVFEKDIMKVKKGQKIIFKIPESSTETFEGEVHLVGTSIDETTRRIKVHGHVDNERNPFIVGMYVTAEIVLSDQLAMGLPKTAIVSNNEGAFIFVKTKSADNKESYKKTKVSLGKDNETYTEILNPEGLKGKQIVIAGINELTN